MKTDRLDRDKDRDEYRFQDRDRQTKLTKIHEDRKNETDAKTNEVA
jgi:hypothetical protein